MATEYFVTSHDAGKTVYLRFMRATDSYIFDQADDTWKVNLAACTTPKLACTENTDMGDAATSQYTVSQDLALLYNGATPLAIIVQGMDDLAADLIIFTDEIVLKRGVRIDVNAIRGIENYAA